VWCYSRPDAVPPVPPGGPDLRPVEDGPAVRLHRAAVSGRDSAHTQLHHTLLRESQGVGHVATRITSVFDLVDVKTGY